METETRTDIGPAALAERLCWAINRHDLDALAACFASDFRSEFPAHPDQVFRGHDPLRKNWSQIFGAVPDISSELPCSAVQGDTIWAEWVWRGTRRDGAVFHMRGVTIQRVEDDRIAWTRLYMEPVRAGAGTDAAVRQVLTERDSAE